MPIKQFIKTNIPATAFFAVAASTVAVILLLLTNTHPTIAKDNPVNTLKVSPVRSDLEIKPGSSKTVPVTVTNLTEKPITVLPIANDFIAGDEQGTPAIILDPDEFAPTHSLKRFMQLPKDKVTIPANGAKQIKAVITVPKDAQAGGYFGAVRFAPAALVEGGQVDLSTSVASLILLKVPGDTVEKLNLTDFEIKQNNTSGWLFNSPDKLQVFARFENKGNVQVGPFGQVAVREGDKVIYTAKFNDTNPRDVILPDSARYWNIPLHKISDFGKHKVTATFTYGKENQTIQATKTFWVVPLWMFISAGIGLLVLIAVVVSILVYRRRSKSRMSNRFVHGGRRRR